MTTQDQTLIAGLIDRCNENSYTLATAEEWEALTRNYTKVQAEKADLKKRWLGVVCPKCLYSSGRGEGCVDYKFGRNYFCPETKQIRGLSFMEFYEGSIVD